MKILYLSCHAVLEFDEIRILNQLGYDVTSIGSYINPLRPHSNIRPPLNITWDEGRESKIHSLFSSNLKKGLPPHECSNTLTKDVVDEYDVIIVMHKLNWIEKNWDVLKNKIVVLRTIGQNVEQDEKSLTYFIKKGVKVLRYSPKEREIKNYAGEHGLVRFLKYKSDFKPRNNIYDTVISFGQSIQQRGKVCASSIIEEVANKVPCKLYGPNNENYNFFAGNVSYEKQLEVYSTNSCYLYTGTYPAQYTLNFVEALISGIPIVSIGKKISQELIEPYPFEVPELLDDISGFYHDDVELIIKRIQELLSNRDLNGLVSGEQIKFATEIFSVEKNIYKWSDFLNNL